MYLIAINLSGDLKKLLAPIFASCMISASFFSPQFYTSQVFKRKRTVLFLFRHAKAPLRTLFFLKNIW
jgi:hypothetical protein